MVILNEVLDEDCVERSRSSSPDVYPTGTGIGPWVLVGEPEEERIRKISRWPNFVIPTRILLHQMKKEFAASELNEEDLDDLKSKFRSILKRRIADLLKNVKEYVRYKEIVVKYREQYSIEEDKRLIQNMIANKDIYLESCIDR